MLDNRWRNIFSSPFQNLDCLASYSITFVTKDRAQKLYQLQPDSLTCLTAEAVTEGANESEGEVLSVLLAMAAPMLLSSLRHGHTEGVEVLHLVLPREVQGNSSSSVWIPLQAIHPSLLQLERPTWNYLFD